MPGPKRRAPSLHGTIRPIVTAGDEVLGPSHRIRTQRRGCVEDPDAPPAWPGSSVGGGISPARLCMTAPAWPRREGPGRSATSGVVATLPSMPTGVKVITTPVGDRSGGTRDDEGLEPRLRLAVDERFPKGRRGPGVAQMVARRSAQNGSGGV